MNFKLMVVCGLFFVSINLTAWEKDGSPVCTAKGLQWRYKAGALTEGRVAITWEDGRNDTSKIYLQVLDSLGNPLFTKDGIRVSQRAGTEVYHQMATNGSDIFIAWEGAPGGARVNTDIFMTRIDGVTGVKKWGDIGVCVADGDQYEPQLCLDGSGEGYYVTWTDYRSGNADVWAARITQEGQVAWEKRIGNGGPLRIITSGNSAIIVGYRVWKIDSMGNFQWDSAGVPIADVANNQAAVSDRRNGVIVLFAGNALALSVQRIDSAGIIQWGSNGVVLQTWPLGKTSLSNVLEESILGFSEDGFGGCLISSYRGMPTKHQVYRVDSSGTNRWPLGVVVWTSPGEGIGCSTASDITYDNLGGCMTTWSVSDSLRGDGGNIVVQRVDTEGEVRFEQNGVSLCSGAGTQINPVIIGVSGGAVVCWEDNRNGDTDIYAQLIDTLGNVGIKELGQGRFELKTLNLEQNLPNPFNSATEIKYTVPYSGEISVKIYDALGREIKNLVNEYKERGAYSVQWDGLDDYGEKVSAGVYFCRLSARSESVTQKMIKTGKEAR